MELQNASYENDGSSNLSVHESGVEAEFGSGNEEIGVVVRRATQMCYRKRRDGLFETRKKVRNQLDKSKVKSLNNMLTKWYEKTNTPSIALTLLKSKEGQICVKYSGPKEFSAFGNDEMIMKKFVDVITDGMKRKAVQMSKNTQDELGQQTETRVKGIDESLVKILLEEDVFQYPIDEKRKLITQIVAGSGTKESQKWNKQHRPFWWPSEIDFRSPNKRNPSMTVYDLDHVLDSCSKYVKTLCGLRDDEMVVDMQSVEGGEDCEDGMEGDNVGDEVVEDDRLDFAADCINLNQGRESKECLCMWGKQCSAGESCCVCLAGGYNLGKNVDSPCTKCCDCEKHFHEICVKEALGSELNGWSCGCKTSFEELKSLDKFKNIDNINYMFRRWSREIKKFVTEICSERIGSKRKRIVDLDKACYLSSDMMNFYWLLGDESVGVVVLENVKRLAYSLPCVLKYGLEKRSKMCRFCLAPEILAFLLHKEETCSLLYSRKILLENHDV